MVKKKKKVTKKKPAKKKVERVEDKSKEYLIKSYLERGDVKYKSLGMGLHRGVFYFGTAIYKGTIPLNAVITSDKKIYVCWEVAKDIVDDDIKFKFGLNYRYDFFKDVLDHTWSSESINSWLYGKPKIMSLKELYVKIKELNQKYLYHHDKRVHSFVAVDIISSYFLELFEAKGRVLYVAEKESGKTEQSKMYQRLGFNPFMYGDGSSSSYYRIVEATKGTPIIEDFDLVREESKNDQKQLLRVGYKKNIKAIRSDGRYFRPGSFDLYSSAVVNNIGGLDDVTESRCISIMMLKTSNKNLTNKRPSDKDKVWRYTRDNLFMCALENWKNVQDSYDSLEVKELGSRALEICKPHLAIAKLIDKNVYDELVKFFVELNDSSQIQDLENNWGFLIVKWLYENVKDKQQVFVKDMVAGIQGKALEIDENHKDFKKRIRGFSIYVGKYLKSYSNYFKPSMVNGCMRYEIDPEGIAKLVKMKNWEKQIPDFIEPVKEEVVK